MQISARGRWPTSDVRSALRDNVPVVAHPGQLCGLVKWLIRRNSLARTAEKAAKARQCLSCGMDWHDADNVVQRGDPNWNRFGLDASKTYVVELLQHPDGRRTTQYRESQLPQSENAALETEPASGQQFIDWGYYTYSQHLRLTDGRSFGFDAHGVWLTDNEIAFMRDRSADRTESPWENGIAPLFAPK